MSEDIYARIRRLREEKGWSQQELAERAGFSTKSTISRIENGERNLVASKIKRIAEALGVSGAYLIDGEKESVAVKEYKMYYIPTYESVSAGLGAYADNNISTYTPLPFLSKREADESFCVKVVGDSMYPKIENGDTIVIRKSACVENGDIAAVLVDGNEGYVKKFFSGKGWVRLESINPLYPPMEFKETDIDRVYIEGKVTKIIKEM